MRQIQRVGSAGLLSVVLEEKKTNAPGHQDRILRSIDGRAQNKGWIVISMNKDRKVAFPFEIK